MLRTWGDATYPMEYVYDSYGQKTELHTYRSGKGWQLANFPSASAGTVDVTKWIYHESSGLLNRKEDALGRQTVFAYDAGNRLLKRAWARSNAGSPVECIYAYDPNTGEVTLIDYSDATPDVAMGYDRRGRTSSVTDAAGAHTVVYNAKDELAGDSIVGGILGGISVSIGYDGFLRRGGLQALAGATSLVNQGYTYDTSSRLETVTSGMQTATYSYHATNGLLNGTSYTGGTSVARSYDALGRIQSVTNTPASGGPIIYAYTYNNLNQRTRVTREDNSYWSYNYNDRGELEGGKKFWSDNSPVAGQQFEFGYDNIGNRDNAKSGGDAAGGNLRASGYATNALNQYGQRSVPGAVDVIGTSDASATVTVNDQATYRKGDYFQTTIAFDNSTAPISSPVSVIGVKQNAGPNGEDAVEQKDGSVFLPSASEAFGYDLDGNLLTDGRWQYTWDAENRLTSMTALPSVPAAAKKKLEFVYDYLGRRIQKNSYVWNSGTAAYDLQSITKFVYDGWNLIAELDDSNALVKNYVWGEDLSGTLQGAGGVGGLLLISDATGVHQVGYDGNGNVGTLVKAADGTVVAAYDYDPFGNTLQENGNSSSVSPFRFSTKYTDSETSLIYYGHRFYNSQTGRWISRDPVEETGGVNLYGFVSNAPANKLDQLGMYEIDVHYYLTYFLAERVGCFDASEARQIALGDQITDELEYSLPGRDRVGQNTTYHALHAGAVPGKGSTLLWHAATKPSKNNLLFERYLHYFQDTYSHGGGRLGRGTRPVRLSIWLDLRFWNAYLRQDII